MTKTKRTEKPRLHVAGTFEFSHYWRQWSEVLTVVGDKLYQQAVTVRDIGGPTPGRVRTHATPLDKRDLVTTVRPDVK